MGTCVPWPAALVSSTRKENGKWRRLCSAPHCQLGKFRPTLLLTPIMLDTHLMIRMVRYSMSLHCIEDKWLVMVGGVQLDCHQQTGLVVADLVAGTLLEYSLQVGI